MEQVLTKALAFVAVIALGYFLKKRGFFKPHDYELIAKIVLNITLPCAVITSFAAFKMDYTLFILTLIGFCGNLLMIAWGFMSLFLSGIFKVGDFKCIVEIIIVI